MSRAAAADEVIDLMGVNELRMGLLVAQARAATLNADDALPVLYNLVRAESPEFHVDHALIAAYNALRGAVRADTLAAERAAQVAAENAARQERRARFEAAEAQRQEESAARRRAAYEEWSAMTPEERAERRQAREDEKEERRRLRAAEKAERARRRDEEEARDEYYRSGQAVRDAYEKLVEHIREEAYIEWTADLLAAEFATGDGHHVTWGAATVAQHRSRVAMHSANAQAGIDGAARHLQAIEDIERSGSSCLNDALAVAE